MTTRTRSAIIILGTLLLGIVIGGLGVSAIISSRVDQFRKLRMQGGARGMIEDVLAPTDDAQRKRIATALDTMAQRHARLRESTMEHHASIIDSLRSELESILTADQLKRFDQWRENDRGAGGGSPGPGFGPPPGLHHPPGSGGPGHHPPPDHGGEP